jgi:hypothetical protein
MTLAEFGKLSILVKSVFFVVFSNYQEFLGVLLGLGAKKKLIPILTQKKALSPVKKQW